MERTDIHIIAKEFTTKDINNILKNWNTPEDIEQVEMFNRLVAMGDSRGLAMATTIFEKYNDKPNSDLNNGHYS